MRIGHGYDAHRLVPGRRLILGGVDIPHEKGLMGHSDADVLTHAVIDAVIGALGLGDIGRHFPDSDAKYKDISSLLLAEATLPMLEDARMEIANVDATVIAQAPRIAAYITLMKGNLARALKVPPERINIKATTEEGLGFTGAEQGIAAHAVCLLCEKA